jgi:hypothetical protein
LSMHKRNLCIIAVLAFYWAGTTPLLAQEIDRLLAAVNGRVITEWDFKMARILNALLEKGRSLPEQSRREELDRLIDRELLRQELENFAVEQGDQSRIQAGVQETVDDLKQAYAEIGGLSILLRRLGLAEDELVDYVRLQIRIVRFTRLRFAPFVPAASDLEVDDYYKTKLLPRLQHEGAAVPPLSEVSSAIREILREEKINSSLDGWILNIRSHSRIEFYGDASLSPGKEP